MLHRTYRASRTAWWLRKAKHLRVDGGSHAKSHHESFADTQLIGGGLGALADLAATDRDPFAGPAASNRTTRTVGTWVAGRRFSGGSARS